MTTGFKGPLVHGTRSTQEGYAYRNRMGMMNSAEFCVFHDDFTSLVTTNVPTGWAAAIIDSGATVATNTTAAIGANGVLTFADATASEGAAIYTAKAFQLTAGKKAFVECRFRTDDVTDSTIQFGLSSVTASTDPEDLWDTSADSVVSFGIADGAATTVMYTDSANAGITTTAGDSTALTADAWHTLAIYFDGTAVSGWVNGTKVVSTTTTVPTGVALAGFFGALNGNGAGGNLFVLDYFRVAVER